MWLTPLLPAAAQVQSGEITFRVIKRKTGYIINHSVTIPAPNPDEVLVFHFRSALAITTFFSDTGGGTYVADVLVDSSIGFYRRIGGSTSGNITITWSIAGQDVGDLTFFYLKGVDTVKPVDTTLTLGGGFSVTPSVTITTTVDNALVLVLLIRTGFANDVNLVDGVYPTTFIRGTTPSYNALCLNNAGTAGPKTLTATWSEPAAGWQHIAVAYRPKAVPRTDITTTNWKTSWGSQFSNKLTESSPDDGDFVVSPSVLGVVPKVEKAYQPGTFGSIITTTIDPPKTGNTLLVAFILENANLPFTITDNQNNTYVKDLDSRTLASETRRNYYYRLSNVTNAPTSITLDVAGNTSLGLTILEVNGLDPANPLDSVYSETSNINLVTSTRTYTTNNNNCFGWGYLEHSNSKRITLYNNWVDLANSGVGWVHPLYNNNVGVSGTKSITSQVVDGSTSSWFNKIDILTYRPAQPAPITLGLGTTLKAGTYMMRFRATKDMPDARIRLVLSDGVNDLGATDWIEVTGTNSYDLYEVPVTITGTCNQVKVLAEKLAEIAAPAVLLSGI